MNVTCTGSDSQRGDITMLRFKSAQVQGILVAGLALAAALYGKPASAYNTWEPEGWGAECAPRPTLAGLAECMEAWYRGDLTGGEGVGTGAVRTS